MAPPKNYEIGFARGVISGVGLEAHRCAAGYATSAVPGAVLGPCVFGDVLNLIHKM